MAKPIVVLSNLMDFKPVAYPKSDHGKFYTGDSYIILYTKKRNDAFSWDIHFWLGSQTSQDEAGSAAILTVQLDDQLNGVPIQHREVQDYESQLFLSYFKSGIRYLPGGVSSGFAHVDRTQHDKKLYQVKGKKNIRIKQVDLTIKSMNQGDCFILDTGDYVYVYTGIKAKRAERIKAIHAANLIRDQDNGGRSKVRILDEFTAEEEFEVFFTGLGGGSKQEVASASAGGDDEQFEKSQEKQIRLYRISDDSGKLKIDQITERPLQQKFLDTKDCFVLDTTDSNLFVWVGKECTNIEKNAAMSKANEFLKTENFPAWTQITRIVEGAEPSAFQQYFKTWKVYGEIQKPRLIRSFSTILDNGPKRLAVKSVGRVHTFMPDDGSGDVTIYRVEKFELVPVPEDRNGMFYGGDSYIVKYHKDNKWIIYIWQGSATTIDEKAASAVHAVEMDNNMGGAAIQIQIVQDEEPEHFLRIFKGKLITLLGGKGTGFNNAIERDHNGYSPEGIRLFRIRGTSDINVRASQLPATAKSLASDDVFILETREKCWIWNGKESEQIERDLVGEFAKRLVPNISAEVISEGGEPEEFWNSLQGKEEYSTGFEQPTISELKLLHVKLTKNNQLKLDEMSDFEQGDLVEDDVMLLDTGYEMFVWIGKDSDPAERKEALNFARKYIQKYHRSHYVTLVVKQGDEPEAFKAAFPKWDASLWAAIPTYEHIKHMFQRILSHEA